MSENPFPFTILFIILFLDNEFIFNDIMKENERLIRTIYVSNVEKMDIFRIHIFEKSLKFDSRFAYGISKNDAVYEMVCEIEALWQRRIIDMQGVFTKMVDVITQHEPYLRHFYFKPQELDFTGKLMVTIPMSAKDDKYYSYYMCRKNQDNFRRIKRKEFEDKMTDSKIKYTYIERYYKKDVSFYQYRISGLYDNGRNCYLMMVGDDLKLGYVES